MDQIYLSRNGFRKLAMELDHLKNVRRRELSRAIAEARAHGDLSENAEYDAAKEAQGQNEAKIAELEFKLSRVSILDDQNIPTDEVLIGATVVLKDTDTGEELKYMLVAEEEADYDNGKISVSCPVGKALLNKKEGEVVCIEIPAGKLNYQVVKISRE